MQLYFPDPDKIGTLTYATRCVGLDVMTMLGIEGAVDHRTILKDISRVNTQFDMLRLLKTVTEAFGMRAFIVFRLPETTELALQAATMISNWPSQIMGQFDASQLLRKSPAIESLRRSTIPFCYDLDNIENDEQKESTQAALEVFGGNRMVRAVLLPVCDPTGMRGCVHFSGDRALPEDYEILQLLMIATHAYDRLYQISRRDVRTGDELTDREIDCLTWTAAGKTSAEIAEILGLSEHTVNHYLNRAARKLDTVNRTQAVAKAIRTGVIR